SLALAVVVTVLPVSAAMRRLAAVLPVEFASMYACVVSVRVARATPAPAAASSALPDVVRFVPAVLALIDTSPVAWKEVVPVRYAFAVVVTSTFENAASTSGSPPGPAATALAFTVEVAEIVTLPNDVIVASLTATIALEFTET